MPQGIWANFAYFFFCQIWAKNCKIGEIWRTALNRNFTKLCAKKILIIFSVNTVKPNSLIPLIQFVFYYFQRTISQLFEAVDHLENIGITHRDIKPDNIFVKVEKHEVPKVVLGDWGCATDQIKFKNEDIYNNGDLRRGNPAYSPPEIITAGRGKMLDYTR